MRVSGLVIVVEDEARFVWESLPGGTGTLYENRTVQPDYDGEPSQQWPCDSPRQAVERVMEQQRGIDMIDFSIMDDSDSALRWRRITGVVIDVNGVIDVNRWPQADSPLAALGLIEGIDNGEE